MKIKRVHRLLIGSTCGACLLQATGCTIDQLLTDVSGLILSALLSQLLGTPLL